MINLKHSFFSIVQSTDLFATFALGNTEIYEDTSPYYVCRHGQ